ncbi:MAG: tRNA (adenosine(37)-N6)-threonylcarbamoyltransferase complex transferase subunit TsaD [bacterium]
MLVLGIETSCDETAAAVVKDARTVLSSVVYSQIPLHQAYGGVVPEIASRSHLEKISGIIEEAMAKANVSYDQLDAIAVTYGPGLASSLIVGLSAAKGLAMKLGKPLIGINHLEAHIHSVFLRADAPDTLAACPLLALVVSGGHTCWIDIPAPGQYQVIGQTLDDAAGEAFDKAAKLLGLGYPGGPVIDKIAKQAKSLNSIVFPKGRPRAGNPALGTMEAEMCVSFSGLKTALMYYLKANPPTSTDVPEIAASYQEAIVGALVDRCTYALNKGNYRTLAVGGGVSLNRRLRERLTELATTSNVRLLLAEPKDCGDNAAMIAGLAGMGFGVIGNDTFLLDVVPSLEIGKTR